MYNPEYVMLAPYPRNPNVEIKDYVFEQNMMDPKECDRIVKEVESNEWHDGSIGTNNDSKTSEEIRKVSTQSLPLEQFRNLYERVMRRVQRINEVHYQFNLTGIGEPLCMLKYTSEGSVKGHYDWHVDLGHRFASCRKLSVVIQLTDPTEYGGCDLILHGKVRRKIRLNKGSMVVFPSYLLHKVNPIESGTRYAIVTWVTGPKFQ